MSKLQTRAEARDYMNAQTFAQACSRGRISPYIDFLSGMAHCYSTLPKILINTGVNDVANEISIRPGVCAGCDRTGVADNPAFGPNWRRRPYNC
jgi:hypothetical protein